MPTSAKTKDFEKILKFLSKFEPSKGHIKPIKSLGFKQSIVFLYKMLQYLKNKPSITYTLIILNIVMYIVMTLFGGTENIANLVRFGAKYSPYIINGQYWRLITPMFIHIGLQHLLINMMTKID